MSRWLPRTWLWGVAPPLMETKKIIKGVEGMVRTVGSHDSAEIPSEPRALTATAT